MTAAHRQALREGWARRIAAGLPGSRLGKKHTAATRAKISAIVRERTPRGEACHSFKDGKLAERRGERFGAEYKRWLYDVFLRDGFKCIRCADARGGNLVAHHIIGFATAPALRYIVSNGETLCEDCHKAHHETHGYC